MAMNRAHIALGSNLGDRLAHLQFAIDQMAALPDLDLRFVSSIYEAAAHTLPGSDPQPAYLNAVVEVATRLAPIDLLEALLGIEHLRGRDRKIEVRWSSRVLDLDLVTVENHTSSDSRLILPHPRLSERAFVLKPLAEIAPDLHIPAPIDKTVRYLLSVCDDTASLEKTNLSLRTASSNEPV